MTTSVNAYQKNLAAGTVDREVATKLVDHIVNADQDTANSATITVSDITAVQAVVHAQIESTTGVFRNPQGIVSKSGNTVTVADSGLVVNEIIHLTVVGYSAV